MSALLTLAGATVAGATRPVAATDAETSWIHTVNAYRSMSGLPAVSENAEWSAQARDHSCYMLTNGISHDELPEAPGYTPGGDDAGNSGNVAVSSDPAATARSHVELWMTGPFHAIGLLRHNLVDTGFGLCSTTNTNARWRSGATLDVIRGVDQRRPRPSAPIVFPGRDATVRLDRFITESPNPVSLCGWSGTAGLPLVVMMPDPVAAATASIDGPGGSLDTCVLHAGNVSEPTARAVLASEHAIVIVPRAPLEEGRHTATVDSDGGRTTWSFTIDPDAELVESLDAPTTAAIGPQARFRPVAPYRHADSRSGQRLVRLTAGEPRAVQMAGTDITAVSANFTIDQPGGTSFLTVYNCTTRVPVVSTLNFDLGAAPNQAIVPLDRGRLCVYSPVATDIIIDVNGFFGTGAGASAGFVPLDPARLLDTRAGSRLRAGERRAVAVERVPNGAPGEATAVALNVTVVAPSSGGFVRVVPCDRNAAPDVSNVNFAPHEDRPNSVIVPTAADGTVCVTSTADADVLVDIAGYFVDGGGYAFEAVTPIRLLDTRSLQTTLNPATGAGRVRAHEIVRIPVAGRRGISPDARAISVNLTATGSRSSGFVTAFPCGRVPDVSNLNTSPDRPAIANGAMVPLSDTGELCLYADHSTHLLVDVNGVWL